MSRPLVVGPENGPESPYPIRVNGRIIRGFGRGSKELGIPTANIPIDGAEVGGKQVDSGIYYGWAGLKIDKSTTSDASQAAAPVQPNSSTESAPIAITASTSLQAVTNTAEGFNVYPMVVSIGYNPFYNNTKRSVEVHIMHDFPHDFYNAQLNLSILGFIRAEQNYDSMDALIEDIKTDIEVSRRSLQRPAYEALKQDPYLSAE